MDVTKLYKENITPGYCLLEDGKWHKLSFIDDKMFVDDQEVVYKEKKNG